MVSVREATHVKTLGEVLPSQSTCSSNVASFLGMFCMRMNDLQPSSMCGFLKKS